MKRPLSTLKSWFRRGLKPIESQFSDWLDSFWHKDDMISQENVSNLSQEISNLTTGVNFAIQEANAAEANASEAKANAANALGIAMTAREALEDLSENISENFYTKENLQTTGQAQVDFGNVKNIVETDSIFFETTGNVDTGIVTRNFAFKITEKTDVGGVSTLQTSAGAAYALDSTVSAGDFVKVIADTVGMRTFLKVERV